MRFSSYQETIKKRRKVLGITQADLAEIAGVGKRTVFQIENGSGNPTVEVLDKIMKALGVDITYIVKGSE